MVLAVLTAACGSEDPGKPSPTPDGGSSPDMGTVTMGDYFPFALGNTWEYDVTELGKVAQRKQNKIVRMEAVGGTGPDAAKVVYRVETTKVTAAGATPGDATISWQIREGARVVRYREESCAVGTVMLENGSVKSCNRNEDAHWTPARIRIDENPMGQMLGKDLAWKESFKETKTTFSPAGAAMGTTVITDQIQDWKVLDLNATTVSGAGTFAGCLVLQKTSESDVPKKYTFCRGIGKVREEAAGQTEVLAKYTIN